MTKLSVNLNKIALIRNTRALDIPNVLKFASIALVAGADGITIHPRPDERHIRANDVPGLAALMRQWPDREFNIEGNPFHNLMTFARDADIKPHQLTLVPDAEGQATSDHGWDLTRDSEKLAPVIAELRTLGVRVSLFMDADPSAMALAAALGVDRVELYTEPYAANFNGAKHAATLAQFVDTAKAAQALGIGVNAGHDLNLENLPAFAAAVPDLLEVSIGHALIGDALEYGLTDTVHRYQQALQQQPIAK